MSTYIQLVEKYRDEQSKLNEMTDDDWAYIQKIVSKSKDSRAKKIMQKLDHSMASDPEDNPKRKK